MLGIHTATRTVCFGAELIFGYMNKDVVERFVLVDYEEILSPSAARIPHDLNQSDSKIRI
jgi:hypothetical protein